MEGKNALNQEIFDVAVIGGGPSGMMAAGRAAERGLKVILIEKNKTLGKKLLITGGGRCNLTNAEFDIRVFLSKFKENDKFLFSAFSEWDVEKTIDFFEKRKMPTKIEAEKRVFPASNKAESVWNTLLNYLKEGNVTVASSSAVIGIEKEDERILSAVLKNKKKIHAKSFILATGGKSRPETGSTGEGFDWLRSIGHKVSEPSVSLVPVKTKDAWVKRLQGVTIKDVKLTLFQNGVKQEVKKGKILFTHFGITGPTVLNMSRDIGELLKYGEVVVSLDLLPNLDYGMLNEKLQEIFKENSNKKFKNALDKLIPSALVLVLVELSGINGDVWCHSVTREERLRLVKLLKDIPMNIQGLLGVEKAIVTSGGVKLEEVDFKTMRSRIFQNLYLIGDVLDIDRPSGGYSLQLCWTTGFVAGNSVPY